MRGQSLNQKWFSARCYVITGTSAHSLNIASTKGIFFQRHAEMITKKNDRKLYVLWGQRSEGIAKWQFIARHREKLSGFEFQERGMLLDEKYPFLSALLLIWTPLDHMELIIPYDPIFANNLVENLAKLYLNSFLPGVFNGIY